MMNIPALTYRTVPDLIRQIARYNPALKPLAGAPDALLTAVFTPVAVLAWLIAKHRPELRELPRLRVLVAGAEYSDAADGGLGYGLLPAMIGSTAQIEVDLVGEELSLTHIHIPASGARVPAPPSLFGKVLKSALPALRPRVVSGKVSKLIALHPDAAWDVAIASSPGFEVHLSDWMAEGEFDAVVERSGNVFLCGYTEFDRVFDHIALRSFGYADVDPLEEAPFAVRIDAVSRMFGFPSRVGPRTHAASVDAAVFMETLSRATRKTIKYHGCNEFLRPPAAPMKFAGGELYALFGDLAVQPAKGIVNVAVGTQLYHYADYDPEDRLAPPALEAPLADRVTWSLLLISEMDLTDLGREILDATHRAVRRSAEQDFRAGGAPTVNRLIDILEQEGVIRPAV